MALSIGISVKANGASSATTASQTTTAGSAIQVQVTCTVSSGSPPTVSDSKGNTYTLIGSGVQVSATPGSTFIYKNEGGGTRGSSHTWSVTANDVTILVIEILGTNPVVDTNSTGNTDSSSPYESGSITPSVADFCLVGTVAADGSVTSWTAGASYTKQLEETNHSSYWPCALGTLLVTGGSGSYLTSWTSGTGSGTYGLHVVAWKESGPSPTLDQEGFRFRNDDGSETTATWAASQDTNHTAPLSTNLRLRVLVDAENDPASAAYTLRYQKNGSGGYVAVPVGASTIVAPTVEAADCTESGNNTATTSWAVSYPAYASGDLLVFHVASDADVTHNWPATGPNGETINTIVDSTGGTAQRASGFWFVGSATTGAGTLTVTPSATEQWTAVVLKVPAGEFNSTTPIQTNVGTDNDTTADASWATPAWTSDATAGGRVVCFAAHDVVTTSATPAGWSTLIARDRGAVGCTLAARDTANTASETIASASFTKSSETDSSFGYVINGVSVTNEVYIATSSNITGGGEATTAQLTAPSGKSTSDFVTGRMWDDENGTDPINITTDDYTEIEWCLKAQSPAVNTDYFEFRVYNGSSAFDSYTVTPKWTIGASGSYSLAMGQGSYSQTGQAVALRVARKMAAAQGSYSLTGQAVALVYGHPMAAAQGTYSLTGQSVGLKASRKMAAAQGSYTLSGQAVSLNYSPIEKTIQIGQGTYSLTGQDAALRIARRLAAAQGSYALTGQAVGLKFGHKLIAALGTYTVTGSDAVCDFAITISSGTYTLTGQAVTLTYGAAAKVIAIEQATYSLTGQTVGLKADRKLVLAQGSYSLTGQVIGLKRGLRIAIGHGAYSLTGTAVGLRADRRLALAQGTYTITGQTLNLKAGHVLPAGQGTYSLSGTAVALTYSGEGDKTISIGQGSYTLAGQNVALRVARKIAAAAGAYTVNGQTMGLRGGRRLALAQGTYTLTGQALAFARTRALTAGQGAYSLSGQSVGERAARRVTMSQGSYTLTGAAAGLLQARRMAAGQGSYTLTGAAAALRAARKMALAAGSYSLTGQSIAFNYSGALTPISTERTYLVRAENRRYIVTAEDRAYSVRAENRTWRVTT